MIVRALSIFSNLKKGKTIFTILLLIIITINISISGCLSKQSSNSDDKQIKSSETFSDQYRQYYTARSNPQSLTQIIQGQYNKCNITKVIVNITVLDDDEGTESDSVERIEYIPYDINDEPLESIIISGGIMPFRTSFEIEADPTALFGENYKFMIDIIIRAGEDQWPGPIIWNGVEDTGYLLLYDISYEWIEEE